MDGHADLLRHARAGRVGEHRGEDLHQLLALPQALHLGVAALTAGLRRSGALAGLLMLPLAVPLLIFGAGLVERGNQSGALQFLAAVSLLLVAGAPFVAGAAIRAGRE